MNSGFPIVEDSGKAFRTSAGGQPRKIKYIWVFFSKTNKCLMISLTGDPWRHSSNFLDSYPRELPNSAGPTTKSSSGPATVTLTLFWKLWRERFRFWSKEKTKKSNTSSRSQIQRDWVPTWPKQPQVRINSSRWKQ